MSTLPAEVVAAVRLLTVESIVMLPPAVSSRTFALITVERTPSSVI